jgi:alpha-amylase/alpha-mannosidase (GH57 family)
MLYLSIIYHMHQPYYKNLLTGQTDFPWVRLHGVKDYLDMVQMLENYPKLHQTFNLVPSLIEQIEDYTNGTVKDKFLEHSYKPADELTVHEKKFIHDSFFMINKDRVISVHPRYFELYLKSHAKKEFKTQDYLDLQVWFNLAWIDPYFRESMPELKLIVEKGRHYTEEDKRVVLEKQIEILEEIVPTYKKFIKNNQVEAIVSPFYHPILPLLYNTRIAREANIKSTLPHLNFAYPQDAKAQVDEAVKFYAERFGVKPTGMWPSEMAVSEHILPFLIQAGIKWIVADEAILFKSTKRKKRDTALLYQPHLLKREDGDLNIIFRDRNLSDLIGFTYFNWEPKSAAADLMNHLENINNAFKGKDILVTIAMDGENAWEYFVNDGHDFLEEWYTRMSEAKFLKTVRPCDYLEEHPPKKEIKRLAAGSWIFGEFSKWINNPEKNKGWEQLAQARQELELMVRLKKPINDLAWKQMRILEGSDWYWWFGEDYPGYFDKLFRMHLKNFYDLI